MVGYSQCFRWYLKFSIDLASLGLVHELENQLLFNLSSTHGFLYFQYKSQFLKPFIVALALS
jgi:hypothetical protein